MTDKSFEYSIIMISSAVISILIIKPDLEYMDGVKEVTVLGAVLEMLFSIVVSIM